MSIKLLLADDSITIQKVVGIIFAGDEYELTVVDNGNAAIEKAKEVLPDVVLVDALMPGKNGYEVCQAMRQDPALQHLPLLLLTGAFEPFDEEKARQSGADDFITKPFESQQLLERVSKLLSLAKDRPMGGAVAAAPPAEELVADQDDWAAMTAPDLMAPTPELPAEPEPEAAPLTFSTFESAMADAPAEASVEQVAAADDLWGAFEMEEVPAAEAGNDVQDLTENQFVAGGDELAAALGAPVAEPTVPADDWGAAPEIDFAAETVAVEPAAIDEEVVGFSEEAFTVEPPPAAVADSPEPAFAAAAIAAPVEPAMAPAAPAAIGVPSGGVTLSDEQLQQLVAQISRDVIERIAWEVVPDLAETIIKEEIRKIKEGR
jgi:CheY-like chemotaxis protein